MKRGQETQETKRGADGDRTGGDDAELISSHILSPTPLYPQTRFQSPVPPVSATMVPLLTIATAYETHPQLAQPTGETGFMRVGQPEAVPPL